jgi:hypothetical protein
MACLGDGVEGGWSGAGMTGACVKNFDRCYQNAADICGSMGTAYQSMVDKISNLIPQSADLFVNTMSVSAFALSRKSKACKDDFWVDASSDFIAKCANTMARAIPVSSNACPIRGGGKPQGMGLTKAEQACAAALKKVDLDGVTKLMCPQKEIIDAWASTIPHDDCRPAIAAIQLGRPTHLGLGGAPFRPAFMVTASSPTGFLEDQKNCPWAKTLGKNSPLVTTIGPYLPPLLGVDVLDQGRGGGIKPLPATFGGNGGLLPLPGVHPDQPVFNGWIVPRTANIGATGNGRPNMAGIPPTTTPGGAGTSSSGHQERPPRGRIPSGDGQQVTGKGGGGIGGGSNPSNPQGGPPKGKPPSGQTATGGNGPNTGHINTTKGGNAMDILGDANTAGGMGGAAGSGSGGIGDGRPRPGTGIGPGATSPHTGGQRPGTLGGPPQQAGIPKGGTKPPDNTKGGGPSTVMGQPDTAIKPPPGGKTGTPKVLPTPTPKTPAQPAFQGPIDYGGCAKCGQKPKDDLIVR